MISPEIDITWDLSIDVEQAQRLEELLREDDNLSEWSRFMIRVAIDQLTDFNEDFPEVV